MWYYYECSRYKEGPCWQILKIMANSVWGKWAQNPSSQNELIICSTITEYHDKSLHFHFIVNLYNISVFSDLDQAVIQHYYHIHAAVLQNTHIIDKNNNWSQLCCLESLYIKRRNPMLNVGIKATKELVLFR